MVALPARPRPARRVRRGGRRQPRLHRLHADPDRARAVRAHRRRVRVGARSGASCWRCGSRRRVHAQPGAGAGRDDARGRRRPAHASRTSARCSTARRASGRARPRRRTACAWSPCATEPRCDRPRIARVIVLLTNDDGIGAAGLHALRRALLELDGVDVRVIAPHTNRSGTARSITTRSPIWVEEVEFDDGTTGFATEGTPVDCVRFADLGLLGERPDLIVSGINHGSNLGDDVTYSGTVAAAFEGIVLGLPGGGRLPAGGDRRHGLRGPRVRLHRLGRGRPRGRRAGSTDEPLPEGTLLNINCPAGEVRGIEVTRLGKRLYDDELKLVEEDADGRKRYQIYGFEPSLRGRGGHRPRRRSPAGRVAITPIHFDLTDHGALERSPAGIWTRSRARSTCPRPDERPRRRAQAGRGAAARDRRARPPLLRPRRPDDRRRRVRRAARRAARARGQASRAGHRGLADAAGRRPAPRTASSRSATSSRCSRSATPAAPTSSAPGSSACTTGCAASTSRPASCASSPSRRSTGSRSRCSTRTASSSAARPAATA